MKINPEVINVIKSSQVQDNTLRLPEGKMERKLYEQVSKLLKEMGGKWSSAKKIFVFQEDVAETLADIIAIGEYTPDRKTFQYFPTPLPLAEQVVSRADIQPGESCLEPSAGQGNIARFMPSPHCIELNPKNREVLKEAGFNVVAEDFMKFSPDRLYDVIVMNPPFTAGQDARHIIKPSAWHAARWWPSLPQPACSARMRCTGSSASSSSNTGAPSLNCPKAHSGKAVRQSIRY